MGTHIRESVSIGVVADQVDAIAAGLESDPATRALAPTWVSLRDKADGLAQGRRDLDRTAHRARTALAVVDAAWDESVAAFGRAVVDVSQGRRDQPSYLRFFDKVAPSKVQLFGAGREVETAHGWLVELARNPNEPLAQTWTPRLTAATDALEAACKARSESVKALAPHQTSVVLFIDDVNRELDRLEGDLKKLFPGASERVASYLSATRSHRSSSADEPAPAPSPAPAAVVAHA
jgi:hypothetical protein